VIEKLIPEAVHEYVQEHPKVLVWGCALLVAGSLYNLYDSVSILIRTQEKIRDLASDAAREASEALGG
jgi:hypothetical protein